MNEARSFPDAFPMHRLSSASTSSRADPQRLAHRENFRLGSATIRPAIRKLEGPVGTSAVEPLVMQVLLVLADASGAVVTRDELIRNCWRGHVVGDDSVNRAIAEIRRIGKVTGGGFVVQTIPRVGYRLIATDAPEPPVVDTKNNGAGMSSRRWFIGAGAVAVAGAATFGILRGRAADPADALIAQGRSLALAGTPASDQKAIEVLERAAARSPRNPSAWGALALIRARSGEHALIASAGTPAVLDEARRALALDPGNADANAALALIVPYYGDWLQAERRFDAVLRDNPTHIFTRDSRAFFLGAVGRMRESAESRRGVLEQEPLDSGLLFREVYSLWFLGRVAEADRVAERGLQLWPRHPGLWFARLWVLAGTGRLERAIALVDHAVGRPPLPLPMVATLRSALSAARTGERTDVEAATELVVLGVRKSVAGVVNAMMLLNLMGAIDAAFDVANAYYLEEGALIAAMDWRPGQPIVPDQKRRKTNMLFTPVATAMQRDQRFLPLMKRMGLVDYWNARGIEPDFLKS